MKNLTPYLAILLALTACTHTTPGIPVPPPPAKSNLPVSVTESQPGSQKIVTTFTWGTGGWPATMSIHSFDTLGGKAYRDTALIIFHLTDSLTPPASYDITWLIGTAPPDFGATEHHLLYYDNNKRIIKDSTAVTTGLDLAASVYIYSGSQIVVQKFEYPGLTTPFEQDTLSVTAGNISRYTGYYLGGGAPAFIELDTYTASKSANPLYQARVSNSLGAAFRLTSFGDSFIGDFLSQDLMASGSYSLTKNQPVGTLNYTWTTDASGRVIQGSGAETGSGAGDVFTFQYP